MLTTRTSTLAAAAVLAGGLLAGCGSSSSSSSSAAGPGGGGSSVASGPGNGGPGTTASRASFRACLQAHGVTLPARPSGSRRRAGGYGGGGLFGGGGGGGGGFGRLRANPKLAAAFQACGGGRFPRRRFGVPTHAAIQRFVTCVRRHGYDMPAPNFSGGPIFPSSIRTNAKFQAASRVCASTLFPAGADTGAPPSQAPGA